MGQRGPGRAASRGFFALGKRASQSFRRTPCAYLGPKLARTSQRVSTEEPKALPLAVVSGLLSPGSNSPSTTYATLARNAGLESHVSAPIAKRVMSNLTEKTYPRNSQKVKHRPLGEKTKNASQRGAQVARMMNEMQAFTQGLEAGYAQAVEELREAVERGAVSRKCREALDILEARSLNSVERWLEDSGEMDGKNGVSSPA